MILKSFKDVDCQNMMLLSFLQVVGCLVLYLANSYVYLLAAVSFTGFFCFIIIMTKNAQPCQIEFLITICRDDNRNGLATKLHSAFRNEHHKVLNLNHTWLEFSKSAYTRITQISHLTNLMDFSIQQIEGFTGKLEHAECQRRIPVSCKLYFDNVLVHFDIFYITLIYSISL